MKETLCHCEPLVQDCMSLHVFACPFLCPCPEMGNGIWSGIFSFLENEIWNETSFQLSEIWNGTSFFQPSEIWNENET